MKDSGAMPMAAADGYVVAGIVYLPIIVCPDHDDQVSNSSQSIGLSLSTFMIYLM